MPFFFFSYIKFWQQLIHLLLLMTFYMLLFLTQIQGLVWGFLCFFFSGCWRRNEGLICLFLCLGVSLAWRKGSFSFNYDISCLAVGLFWFFFPVCILFCFVFNSYLFNLIFSDGWERNSGWIKPGRLVLFQFDTQLEIFSVGMFIKALKMFPSFLIGKKKVLREQSKEIT